MKVTAKLVSKDNWRTYMKIMKTIDDKVEDGLKETAEAIAKDAKSSMTKHYPPSSSRGEAPAIRTGNLKDSIKVEEQGRTGGKFATSKDAMAWYIQVDTSNHPDGRGEQYAQALEDPKYLDRPFLRPALEKRGVEHMTFEFKRRKIFSG